MITRDYNSNGLLIKEVRQFWNTDSSAWDNHERQMYEYTDNGKLLLDLFNKWINEEWRTEHGFEYTYDQNGNLVKYLRNFKSSHNILLLIGEHPVPGVLKEYPDDCP